MVALMQPFNIFLNISIVIGIQVSLMIDAFVYSECRGLLQCTMLYTFLYLVTAYFIMSNVSS